MSSSKVIPGQYNTSRANNLFDAETVQTVDGHDIPTYFGPEGSYVDTSERARYLITALVSMSERNRRDGFSIAPYREEYSEPIWSTYGWATPMVVEGASGNRSEYQKQLRVGFWRATGFAALRTMNNNPETRVMPVQLVNPSAQKMWRDFNKAYGHPDDLITRNKYKKLLAKQLSPETPLKFVQKQAEDKVALDEAV